MHLTSSGQLKMVVAGEVDQASGCVLDLRLPSDVSRRIIGDADHRDLNTDVPWLGPGLYGQLVGTERLHQGHGLAAAPRPRLAMPRRPARRK